MENEGFRINKMEEKIEKHEIRIGALEVNDASMGQRVDNLIKSVDGLVSTMKWTMGLIVSIVLGAVAIYFK